MCYTFLEDRMDALRAAVAERAAVDLRTTDDSIDDIAARYGFHSAAYFRETFKACVGMTPSEYRAAAMSGLDAAENH